MSKPAGMSYRHVAARRSAKGLSKHGHETGCALVAEVKSELLDQMLGKHLASIRLQMTCLGATEELLTLTKQMRIDQCERSE
jgi:hypothetical protein